MKLLATMFTAAIAVAALPAQAVIPGNIYELGLISDEVKNVIPVPTVQEGLFEDVVKFNFATSGWAAFEVKDNATTLWDSYTLDIAGMSVELWWVAPTGDELVLGPVVGDEAKAAGFVSAGENYYLKISGTGAGTLASLGGGAPAGMYTASVAHTAAIPEPETWAMMLAGVGLIGMVGLRRNRRPSAD